MGFAVKVRTIGWLLFIVGVVSCSDRPQEQERAADPIESGAREVTSDPRDGRREAGLFSVADPAYLRHVVPKELIAYVRIPSLWGFVSSPKGNLFNRALGEQQHVEAVQGVRDALYKNVVNGELSGANPWYAFLLYDLQSPLELALLPAQNRQAPMPDLLFSARIKQDGIDKVNAWLHSLAEFDNRLLLHKELGEGRLAVMSLGPLRIYLDFDVKERMLKGMAGLVLTEEAVQASLAALAPHRGHPMYVLEQRVDSSGQGLFNWIDMERLKPYLDRVMPPEKRAAFDHSLFAKARTLALGWGVSDTKGRFRVVADIPDRGLRDFFPYDSSRFEFYASGTPKTIVSLSMLTSLQMQKIEEVLADNEREKFTRFRTLFNENAGFPLEDIFEATGPEIFYIADEAGEYTVVRLRDRIKFKNIITALRKMEGVGYREREVAGEKIYTLVIPPIVQKIESQRATESGKEMPAIVRLMAKGNSHIYWVEEGDYLALAEVPQVLMDRLASSRKSTVDAWLREQQHQQAEHALFMLSTRIDSSPRRLYYAYLKLLEFAGDVSGTEVDLFALPTAQNLDFPVEGSYGLQLGVSDTLYSLEIVFENNPLELLINQDPGSVALAGVLAAIAIPAYQDYTLRAKVAGGISSMSDVRAELEAFRQKHGRFPEKSEVSDLAATLRSPGADIEISVMPDSGAIVVTYVGDTRLKGKQLALVPKEMADGRLTWQCRGSMEEKYLPTGCR